MFPVGPSPPFRSPSNGPNASAGKRCMLVCSAALGPRRLRSKCMPRIQGPNQCRVRQSRRRCSQGTWQNAWARRAARSRQRDVRAAPYTHASARAHRCVRRPARPFTAGLLHRCRCDGSWGQTPPGCSVQSGGDWAGHYNSGTGTNCTKSFTPICLGPPFPPLPSPRPSPFPRSLMYSLVRACLQYCLDIRIRQRSTNACEADARQGRRRRRRAKAQVRQRLWLHDAF